MLLSASALFGCRPNPPLTLAYHPFSGYAPAYLAESLELWPLERIKSYRTANAVQSAELLRSGQVDAALLTLDETLRLVSAGVRLRVALIVDQSLGADVMLARQPISELAKLRGQRLGYEVGAVGELLAYAVLDKARLKQDEIQRVTVDFNRHEAAWQQGEVDFLITFYPVSTRLCRKGATVVFDSRQTPGLILDVLAVREQSLGAKKAALSDLIHGWFLALERIQRYEGDTHWRLAQWLELPPAEVYAGFDGLDLFDAAENRAWLRARAGKALFDEKASELAAWMAQRGLLAKEIKPKLAFADLLPDPR